MEKLKKDIEELKFTIILSRALPRVKIDAKRIFVDGVRYWKSNIIALLKDMGVKVEYRDTVEMQLPKEFKGIKLKATNGGLMVIPRDAEDFEKLVDALREEGYYYHDCHYPNVKHKNYNDGKKIRNTRR